MLLKFRAQVGHMRGRVLQPELFTGGIDGLLAGLSRHAENIVRIDHLPGDFFLVLPLRGLFRPASSTSGFLLLFKLPARFLTVTRFQLLP